MMNIHREVSPKEGATIIVASDEWCCWSWWGEGNIHVAVGVVNGVVVVEVVSNGNVWRLREVKQSTLFPIPCVMVVMVVIKRSSQSWSLCDGSDSLLQLQMMVWCLLDMWNSLQSLHGDPRARTPSCVMDAVWCPLELPKAFDSMKEG